MARRFKRTVALDLSGFSSYDVAKMVYKRFEGSSSVQSIQFVPGKNVQITLKDSKTKESIEKHGYITINDARCAVVGGGPKVQNVLIHHYPFEEDNHRFWIALSSFGEVRDIQYQHYPDLCSISTGTRVVKMVRNSPIPRSLDVGGYMCKTWYVGQPVECDICQGGRILKNCPLKGKCRRCLESGHMARDCKNPPKSWVQRCPLVVLGTFSNADFCVGDGDRKSNLFPVEVLHFGGKPFSLGADVRTVNFPLSTKREYIFFLLPIKYPPFLSDLVSDGFKTNYAI